MKRTKSAWCDRKLRDCGYRMTVGRKAVLDVITGAKKHLSAEDIYLALHARYPAVGLTSVYRTLYILVSIGMVYKFDFGQGRAKYELAEGPKGELHHHHLVCTGCGRIIDYSDFVDKELDLIRQTEDRLSKKHNFTITNHLVQFYGLCDRCNGSGPMRIT